MYDAGKILAGLALFAGLVTFPVWYGLAGGARGVRPELKIDKPGEKCVEPKEVMTTGHMQLLDQWRDRVVREGQRDYHARDGRVHEMSLTRTCIGCHTSKAEFCDRCHSYAAVKPYCFDCHVDRAPGGTEAAALGGVR